MKIKVDRYVNIIFTNDEEYRAFLECERYKSLGYFHVHGESENGKIIGYDIIPQDNGEEKNVYRCVKTSFIKINKIRN